MAATNKVAKKPVKAKPNFSKKNSTTMVGKLRKEYEGRAWNTFSTADRIKFHQELNHCNYEFDKSTFAEWTQEYVAANRKHVLKAVKAAPDDQYTAAIGLVAMLINKGADVADDRKAWLDSKVDYLVKCGERALEEKAALAAKAANKPQTKMVDTLSLMLAEIESLIDGEPGSVVDVLKQFNATAGQAQAIKDHYAPLIAEAAELAKGKDRELLEGYRTYKTAAQRRERLASLEKINSDADLYVGAAKAQRKAPAKPRAKKAVPVEKVVAGLKFAASLPDLKIESAPAVNLVGAKVAVLYNSKYKNLIVVTATDEGLSAKGASLTNVATAKQRKLRKPEVTLPEIMKANKARLNVVYKELTTAEADASVRLTPDVVILKVYS